MQPFNVNNNLFEQDGQSNILKNWIDLSNMMTQYDIYVETYSTKNKNYILLDFYWQFYLQLRYMRSILSSYPINENTKREMLMKIDQYMEKNLNNVKTL